MDERIIRLLHVEDSRLEQRVIANHLNRITGMHFDITCAASEDEAVTAFGELPRDLVILDYHLSQGDGLNCLKRLRQQDSTVPIIAVSGSATKEVAAQLLHAGADDYLTKLDLNGATLTRSVGDALARADVLKRHELPGRNPLTPARSEPEAKKLKKAIQHFADVFIKIATDELSDLLRDCDRFARTSGLERNEIQIVIEATLQEIMVERPGEHSDVQRFLRPVLETMQTHLQTTPGG